MTDKKTAHELTVTDAQRVFLICVPPQIATRSNHVPHDEDELRILADPRSITSSLLAALRPVRVISPLSVAGVDAIELAEILQEAGYTGEFYVLTMPLPRPDMVLAEIRRAAPALRVDMIDPHDRSLTLSPQPL